MSHLSKPHFHNEAAAYKYVEARVWPLGATCPKCGERERVSKMQGKSTRIGAYKCYRCRRPFTVKVGTIFESSHVKMHLWLQAIYLMCASKKGISSQQLHRTLGVTVKTAWFMSHRIREAMRSGDLYPFGSGGGVVEIDETFIGVEPGKEKAKAGYGHKNKVFSLLDRDTGRTKSVVVKDLTKKTLMPIILRNVSKEAQIVTDEATHYIGLEQDFASHGSVEHGKGEYVQKDFPEIHTNTIEGYFSIFKRGMRGTYQHCKKKHLHRYLAEFDFRYSNRQANKIDDTLRADLVLMGIKGKRLTYETTRWW